MAFRLEVDLLGGGDIIKKATKVNKRQFGSFFRHQVAPVRIHVMKHIRKQQWMGCAIASAAMLAELSYDEVATHWPQLNEAQMRWPRELRALLESVTDTDWQLSQCWHPVQPLREYPLPQWPAALFIEDRAQKPRYGHWIVAKGEIVHDPGESGAYHLKRYLRKDWVVTWIAQPSQPDELTERQARNRLRTVRNALRLSVCD